MEQITIQVKDKQKARALVDILQSLDFVEVVTSDRPIKTKARLKKPAEFFTLAGIWTNRNVSMESIRNKAWPAGK
jgi:hypothetical protein